MSMSANFFVHDEATLNLVESVPGALVIRADGNNFVNVFCDDRPALRNLLRDALTLVDGDEAQSMAALDAAEMGEIIPDECPAGGEHDLESDLDEDRSGKLHMRHTCCLCDADVQVLADL